MEAVEDSVNLLDLHRSCTVLGEVEGILNLRMGAGLRWGTNAEKSAILDMSEQKGKQGGRFCNPNQNRKSHRIKD